MDKSEIEGALSMLLKHYQDKFIVFTTKHHKEDVVVPSFREVLGASLIVPWIDTDNLGTFSGEIERPGDALAVAELKANLGMDAVGLPFGLSSEGSFGPHPYLPFLSSDQEIMLFVDRERGFKVHEVLLSEQTNFNHTVLSDVKDATEFFQRAQFPSHALIVRPNKWEDKSIIFKGIRDEIAFRLAFSECLRVSEDSRVWIETDMRACFNPSRQRVIAELAARLAKRLSNSCPQCSAPAWGRVRVEKGLPCEYCCQPTDLVASEVYGCVLCDFIKSSPRADGLTKAKQNYCQSCNP